MFQPRVIARMNDLGLLCEAFVTFVENLSSGQIYLLRIKHFLVWYILRGYDDGNVTLDEGVVRYLTTMRRMEDVHGNKRHCGSTLRTWVSMLKSFFKHTKRGQLCSNCKKK